MKPLTKQLLAAYICWVMLHLIFLVAGDNFFGEIEINHYLGHVENEFFPFEDEYGHYMRVYDITEFIIYSILPVAVYWAIRLVKESLPPKEDKDELVNNINI